MEPAPPPAGEPPAVRASDREREATVARLRDGAADGRLTLEDLAGRVAGADRAVTRGELERLTADLPASTGSSAPAGPPTPSPRRWSISLVGGSRRTGRFRQPPRSASAALVGGLYLDLRQAELDGPEVEITQVSLVGGASVVVPDGVEVEVSGVSLIGGHHVEAPDRPPPPGAPVVHIRDFSLIGGLHVSRPREPGSGGVEDRRSERRAVRAARREARRLRRR